MIGAVMTVAIIQSSLGGAATSRHIMVATNYARARMEEIRSMTFANITTTYPANSNSPIDIPSDVLFSGRKPLPSGKWYRTYPNGTSADPLRIQVVVSWVEGSKTRSVNLETLVSSKGF